MITIDNTSYAYNQETRTIYQYCQTKNIVLPCFCYHERLTIAGNCRMCLVEVNGALAVSCAVPVLDRMHIVTTSQRLVHSRETVLEFLLVNHPLDCPICDQGGECDLQDITLVFGMDRGRYYGGKRSVDNLNCFGTLIKTMMTRCIHCTRCVRFLTEYTDTMELGVIGRGNSMEIGTYIEKVIDHELSGNIIDLCPVGALTSMPYSFSARPWELTGVESIDVLDSMGASIRVDVANNTIIRILPILMESINEDWITNKTRYAFDSLNIQRIYLPSVQTQPGQWVESSWANILQLVVNKMSSGGWDNISAICGNFIDLHTGHGIKGLFNSIGSNNIYHQYVHGYVDHDFEFMYLLNHTMEQIERVNHIMLLNTNLRTENPLLNSRIRKNYLNNKVTIYSFGNGLTYTTYPVINIGNSTRSLLLFMQGKYYHFNRWLFTSFISSNYLTNKPITPARMAIIVGQQLLYRSDSGAILAMIAKFVNAIQPYCLSNSPVYSSAPNNLGYITCGELGLAYKNNNTRGNTFTYCVATETTPVKKSTADYVVYQGYQLPENHEHIDVFLPTTTPHESTTSYKNIQGRTRSTKVAVASPQTVLPPYQIVHLLHIIKNKIAPNSHTLVNELETMIQLQGEITYKITPYTPVSNPKPVYALHLTQPSVHKGKVNNGILNRNINNYYTADLVSRYSKTMSLCASITPWTSFSKKTSASNYVWT